MPETRAKLLAPQVDALDLTETQIVIIPRYLGEAESDWYPYLRHELEQRGGLVTVLPQAQEQAPPKPPDQLAEHLAGRLSELRPRRPGFFVVGHSLGNLVLVAALERLAGQKVGAGSTPYLSGYLGVAPWFTLDHPGEGVLKHLDAWLDLTFDFPAIQRLFPPRSIRVMLSDNDPFTAGYRANADLWHHRLGARVTLHTGAAHFNAENQPHILETMLDLLGGARYLFRSEAEQIADHLKETGARWTGFWDDGGENGFALEYRMNRYFKIEIDAGEEFEQPFRTREDFVRFELSLSVSPQAEDGRRNPWHGLLAEVLNLTEN